jgi:hypothetical protein
MMIRRPSVGDLEAIVTKEALEFYHAHGEDSIRILKEAIWLALVEKDDDRALHLDQLLYELEQFIDELNAPKH